MQLSCINIIMKSSFIGLNVDFLATLASTLCIIHCICTPFLLSILPLLGSTFWTDHRVETGFVVFSLLITSCALLKDVKVGYSLPAITLAVIGFGLLAIPTFHLLSINEFIPKSMAVVFICSAHIINRKYYLKDIRSAKLSSQ